MTAMRSLSTISALLLVAACSGGGGNGGTPAPANTAPSFTSPAAANMVENGTAAYQATAVDAEGNPIIFSIAGGADAARFAITTAGALSFVAAPNFEAPTDADGDNVYRVQLRASDGSAASTLDLAVTVTNSREGIAVKRVATGLNQPTFVTGIPGSSDVYVLEKGGNLYRLTPATGARTLVFTVDDLSTDGERGLLGMALLPNPINADRFMIFCTAANGDIELRQYVFHAAGFPPTVLAKLVIPHPGANNHNGGWMGFGPDGYLYVGIGDGGGAGDPGNNAQNPYSQLGKILRINVVSDPYAGAAPTFFTPAKGNPFLLGVGGDPYVFALGLRNPFRASFGPDGRLYIGDVGQGAIEEIDVLRPDQPGLNFGWRYLEGTRPYSGTAPGGLTSPVSQYDHGNGPKQGASIIGGHVYRGPVTSLQGQYVFGDYVSGNIWTLPAASLVQGQLFPAAGYERRNLDFAPDAGTIGSLVSFGEDAAGNLFLVDIGGSVFMVQPG
ncbi:PQQ-dependent sugar dehydrogenase [Nostoc ellipsosporum NOK]|nr:PQQ-dependent sugar dehydrogenase [Nostoc ellipsosporum NOK]